MRRNWLHHETAEPDFQFGEFMRKTRLEVDRLLAARPSGEFELQPVAGASRDDLDENVVEDYLERRQKRNPRHTILPKDKLLQQIGALTEDNVPTVTGLLLYLDWAGKAYGWTALGPLALLATAIVLGVLFVVVEMRAEEPIIPMRLFRNEIFAIGNLYTFLSGVAMFGAIIFLPFYLQIVKGLTPTMSGLAMLPMVLGLLSSSIASGRAITRTGRYKIFPIAGAAVQVVALFFFSRLQVDTPFWQLGIIQLAFGIGLGCTCLLYTSPSPRDRTRSRMPSSA